MEYGLAAEAAGSPSFGRTAMGNAIGRSLRPFTVAGLLFAVMPVFGESWMGTEPLTEEQLASASGRQGVTMQWQVNDTEQNASVADNVLSGNVVTGDNHLTDNAFGQMNGIATVIQNTGNQVVIQDSTQINILINQ